MIRLQNNDKKHATNVLRSRSWWLLSPLEILKIVKVICQVLIFFSFLFHQTRNREINQFRLAAYICLSTDKFRMFIQIVRPKYSNQERPKADYLLSFLKSSNLSKIKRITQFKNLRMHTPELFYSFIPRRWSIL